MTEQEPPIIPGVVRLDEPGLRELARRALARAAATPRGRCVIGIAGIPGSGKSTLAAALCDRLNRDSPRAAAVVPMDGFHLPNATLDALGLRPRKGAPPTFDVEGYADLLARARRGESPLVVPIYDRRLHEPVCEDLPGRRIDERVRVVLTEGNYLLLPTPPWSRLAAVLDECWLLETPTQTARSWILRRHREGGRSAADAEAHYLRNDEPNARLVMEAMREPDLRLRWA